MHATGFIRLK